MKLVPAGISKKTGKNYNAFYSCPSCKKTANVDKIPATETFKQNLTEETKQEQIQKNVEAKRNGINASVALNNAVELHKSETGIFDINEILKTADTLKLWLDKETEL